MLKRYKETGTLHKETLTISAEKQPLNISIFILHLYLQP